MASYPLPWIHHFETYRKRDPAARRRLGEFMADLSNFHTIAGAGDLLPHEVAAAVVQLTRQPPPEPPRVFGRGYAHAFGQPPVDFDEEPYRTLVARLGAAAVFDTPELEILLGPAQALPHGNIQAPQHVGSRRQQLLRTATSSSPGKRGETRISVNASTCMPQSSPT
jgi:hypothetical protein